MEGIAMRSLVLISLSLLGACHSAPRGVEPLPAYDAAIALADRAHAKMPKVFVEGRCGEHFWNELVPYCQYTSGRPGTTSMEYHIGFHLTRVIDAMPDVVLYQEGETQQVGAVSQYIGFGISTTSPIYGSPTLSVCYREAPAVLPLSWNRSSGMVRVVRDTSAAGGIIEGDTLLLIAEQQATVERPSAWVRSPLQREMLGWKPGQRVKAVWIRPGQGRMSGEVTLLTNPRTYAAESDSVKLVMPTLRTSTNLRGAPVWRFDDPSTDY